MSEGNVSQLFGKLLPSCASISQHWAASIWLPGIFGATDGNFWSKRREKEAICFGKYWTSIDFQLLDTESSPSIPLIFSHLSSCKYLRFNNSSLQPLVFVIHTSIDFCEKSLICPGFCSPPPKKSEINRWHFKYLMFTDNFLCSLSSLSSTHSYPPK